MHQEKQSWDFPGSPVVKSLSSNAGDTGSIPGQGTKIPHAAGQLIPSDRTREGCALQQRPRPTKTHKKTKPVAQTSIQVLILSPYIWICHIAFIFCTNLHCIVILIVLCALLYFPKDSVGEENVKPLQYSCLENSMDRGAWQAIVHGVTKSWILLSLWAKIV